MHAMVAFQLVARLLYSCPRHVLECILEPTRHSFSPPRGKGRSTQEERFWMDCSRAFPPSFLPLYRFFLIERDFKNGS